MLHVDVRVRAGSLDLDASFDATETAITAVVGPNGSGKTTLLKAIAGLIPLRSGTITLDDIVLDDVDTGTHVPTERRHVGMVFQNGRLLRHLNCRDNIAFGLRAQRVAAGPARATADEWLARVDLADAADRTPRSLSGGEAQRVALARTLATKPQVLLLDEPFAAVDASARVALRQLLLRELAQYRGIRLLVTHDPVEASVIADNLLVLEQGVVTHSGPVHDVMRRPRTDWLADMVGVNMVHGSAEAGTVLLDGTEPFAHSAALSGPVAASFAPDSVQLFDDPPANDMVAWAVRAEQVHHAYGASRIDLAGPVRLVAHVLREVALQHAGDPERTIWAGVHRDAIDVYSR